LASYQAFLQEQESHPLTEDLLNTQLYQNLHCYH